MQVTHDALRLGLNPAPEKLVSFVIPVLNGERDIARCLRAIRGLKVEPDAYEIIILDNGSTDRTQEIIRDLGFGFLVIPEVHVSALRNRGAAMARGALIAFVDADVELGSDWLQNALAAFEDPQVVASGCFPEIPPQATWVQRTWDLHQRGRYVTSEPWPVAWLPSMNLVVRQQDFLAVAGFDEQLETAEDVDLCYRLGHRGTILCNPAMRAIHWGEARDLCMFWRKEVWRGTGNLKGLFTHGLRWDEIPSLGYPLYVMACGLFFVVSVFFDLCHGRVSLTPLSLVLTALPALLLSLNTARLTQQLSTIPPLFLLYFLYGVARAFSIVKVWTAS